MNANHDMLVGWAIERIQADSLYFMRNVMQGQYQTAISHLKRVLEISKEMSDHVGDADAYGVIADIYTDLNDFDQAAIFYDKYIETMTTEGSVV